MSDAESGLLAHHFLTRHGEEVSLFNPAPAQLAEQFLVTCAAHHAAQRVIPNLANRALSHRIFRPSRRPAGTFYHTLRHGMAGRWSAPPPVNWLAPPAVFFDVKDWITDTDEYSDVVGMIIIYHSNYPEVFDPSTEYKIIHTGGEADYKFLPVVSVINDLDEGIQPEEQRLIQEADLSLMNDELALQLLERFAVFPSQIDPAELTEIARGDVGRLATAIGLLVQSGAVTVRDGKLIRTRGGTKLLRRAQVKMRSRVGRGSLKDSPGFILAALAGLSLLAAKISTYFSPWQSAKGRAQDRVISDAETPRKQGVRRLGEAAADPNYEAYLKDVERLKSEYGECIVAYANGRLIAVGENIKELEDKIPDEYWKGPILIQDIPEKVIKMRKRLRVVA